MTASTPRRDLYHRTLERVLNRAKSVMVVYALIVAAMAGLFCLPAHRLPAG